MSALAFWLLRLHVFIPEHSSGEAGYVTMLTGKDHLINFQSNTIAADMQSVGFDFFLRTVDKYNMCNVSFPTNYTSYLKAVGGYREICNSIGLYGDGTACNATRVCDNYDDLECGFRCEESSVTGIMGSSCNQNHLFFFQMGSP